MNSWTRGIQDGRAFALTLVEETPGQDIYKEVQPDPSSCNRYREGFRLGRDAIVARCLAFDAGWL